MGRSWKGYRLTGPMADPSGTPIEARMHDPRLWLIEQPATCPRAPVRLRLHRVDRTASSVIMPVSYDVPRARTARWTCAAGQSGVNGQMNGGHLRVNRIPDEAVPRRRNEMEPAASRLLLELLTTSNPATAVHTPINSSEDVADHSERIYLPLFQ